MMKLRRKRDTKQPLHYEENILSTLSTVVQLSYNCISFHFTPLIYTSLNEFITFTSVTFIQINKFIMVNYVII